MKLPPFDYVRPATIGEAVALLARYGGDARPLAGGQSLMPMMAFRLANPSMLVDLNKIEGLDRITIGADGGVHLGAMVRWREIEDSVALRAAHPLLAEAVSHIAHYQIRNRGTVGGSLANADPAAELPGIAVTCDAVIEIAGVRGTRTLPAADLFVGAMVTSLAPDEIITGIRFPAWPKERRWAFQEFARHVGDFALAGVAVFYDAAAGGIAGNVHIGVIGANAKPIRIRQAERALEGKRVDAANIKAACDAARAAVDPTGDVHASAAYRRALTATLLERCLVSASKGK